MFPPKTFNIRPLIAECFVWYRNHVLKYFFTQNKFFEGLMNQVDIFSKRLTNIKKIRIEGSW